MKVPVLLPAVAALGAAALAVPSYSAKSKPAPVQEAIAAKPPKVVWHGTAQVYAQLQARLGQEPALQAAVSAIQSGPGPASGMVVAVPAHETRDGCRKPPGAAEESPDAPDSAAVSVVPAKFTSPFDLPARTLAAGAQDADLEAAGQASPAVPDQPSPTPFHY